MTATLSRPPSISTSSIEVRAAGDSFEIADYAVRWFEVSNPLHDEGGLFRERFLPGAFATSLRSEIRVRCDVGHDPEQPLGVQGRGLELVEDEIGLRYRVRLPEGVRGRMLAAKVQKGDLPGSSFKFRSFLPDVEWSIGADGLRLKTVRTAFLFEVGPVRNPAYRSRVATAADEVRARPALMELRSLYGEQSFDEYARLFFLKRRLGLL